MSRELYLTSRVFFVSEVNLSSGDKLFRISRVPCGIALA